MSSDDESVVYFNQDHHECLACSQHVTAATLDGVNQPCGHRAGTLIRN